LPMSMPIVAIEVVLLDMVVLLRNPVQRHAGSVEARPDHSIS
jgi:hypothetical protein